MTTGSGSISGPTGGVGKVVDMPNEVFDTARTVLAVREYRDTPIPDEVLRRILESGRLTASGSNKQPWHFLLVRDRDALRELGSIVKTGGYTAQAPAAVVVAVEKGNHLGLSDASRAIQSMILTAWAEGVGSNWTGFAGRLEEVRTRFGIPDAYEVVGVIPLGYPRKALGRGKKNRKPASEVISSERYGQPFA